MVKQEDFVEVAIDLEMRERALKKHEVVRDIPSRLKSDGNKYGFFGEELVAKYFNVPLIDSYDYDCIVEQKTIDSKSLQCISKPSVEYEASVWTYNKQKTDFYVFSRVHTDQSRGWILGFYPANQWWDEENKDVFFRPKGYRRDARFIYPDDCRNIFIKNLYPIKDFFRRAV